MYEAEQRSRAHYQKRARLYDWANRLAALLRGSSQMRERRESVARLAVQPGARVLEVSVGTGTNAPLILQRLGDSGCFVGVDISRAMLKRCQDKVTARGLDALLVEGEAAHLPFADESFDAVFHHGGFAEFGDKQGAVDQMIRVARSGARIVICDVGVPHDRKLPLPSKLLLRLQPEYDQPPPINLMPASAGDLEPSWSGAWYAIEFVKPQSTST